MRYRYVFPSRLLAFVLSACSGVLVVGFCGVGDRPHLAPAVQTQSYSNQHTDLSVGQEIPRERGLQEEDQYLSVTEADELGLTGGLRVSTEWGVVTAGTDPEQCITAGTTITIDNTLYECTEEDVVTSSKLETIKGHLDWLKKWMTLGLRLKPVEDGIEYDGYFADGVEVLSNRTYNSTDLVVIMTAHPDPRGAVSGYATCYKQDQYSRCTVGQFNWCPKTIDLQTEADVLAKARRLVTHEVFHLLGGVKVNTPMVDDDGNLRSNEYGFALEHDDAYNRTLNIVKTPKVQEMVREHFDCDDLQGMPVEDVEVGAGAHWESRLTGPEVMSYGTATGEPYISDLTLAFLEDTGYYLANYSMGGRFVEPTTSTPQNSDLGILFDLASATEGYLEDYTPPQERNPGALRWGRKEGCGFVKEKASAWGTVSFESKNHDYMRYTCTEEEMDGDRKYGCSYDNRMSAVCNLQEYNTDNPADSMRTCHINKDGQKECASNTEPNGEVPEEFNMPGNSGTRAGYSSSLDYVPTRIGYWNCLDDEEDTGETSMTEDGGQSLSWGSSFTGAGEDSSSFGGQLHCPECRCFISSLIEVRKASTSFPRYGLCYPSNCIKEDVLQVGISKSDGIYWYRCPSDGGKVYIPRLVGSIICPPAQEFCKYENITGYVHAEVEIWIEWLFISLVVLLPIMVLSSFCFCRRHFATACCGEAEQVYNVQKPRLILADSHHKAYLVLKVVNALVIFIAPAGIASCFTASVIGSLNSKYMAIVLPSSITAFIFACAGLYGSASKLKAGRFWVVLWYTYLSLIQAFGMLFISIFAFALPSVIDTMLHVVSSIAVVASDTHEVDMQIGAICVVYCVLFLIGCQAAVSVITTAAVIESALSVLNIVFVLAGIVSLSLCEYVSEQVRSPDSLLFGRGLQDSSIVLSVFLMLIGLVGMLLIATLKTLNAMKLKVLFGMYIAIILIEIGMLVAAAAAMGDYAANTGDLDELSETFSYAYLGGCLVGIMVLVFGIFAAFRHVNVGETISDQLKRTVSLMLRTSEEGPATDERTRKHQRASMSLTLALVEKLKRSISGSGSRSSSSSSKTRQSPATTTTDVESPEDFMSLHKTVLDHCDSSIEASRRSSTMMMATEMVPPPDKKQKKVNLNPFFQASPKSASMSREDAGKEPW
ncbi:hypothetical protein CYMTET_46666 [Cymbomonas tetramitiformis]|uniref:Leishmanolysin-like peptidase n=1 Tax=Cymbomonas tetramitiformis TaxID=36881 RepID=A0AAE0EXE0_9CHLO|nr:hypothetical protein CYMTET_46666 [Cymbomonas tetramitiformis]